MCVCARVCSGFREGVNSEQINYKLCEEQIIFLQERLVQQLVFVLSVCCSQKMWLCLHELNLKANKLVRNSDVGVGPGQ